jgi:serine/threonine-protein kinase RsbW
VQLDVSICLPREAETIRLVRRVVSHALTTFGVTRACVDDIVLALSEACTNVIDHAAASDQYEVRLQVDERHCAISVVNPGSGIDFRSLAGAMPDESSPRGRGVAIMRAVMDGVDFTSEPETGTLVHLVKALSADPGGPLARLRPSSEV